MGTGSDPQAVVALDALASRIRSADDETLVHEGPRWLDEAVAIVRELGGRDVLLEAEPAGSSLDQITSASGFELTRDLYQMRRRLPLGRACSLPIRTFRPGEDDHGLLAVNNRAFDWHPEQGGWTTDELDERMAEPWFDARGLLVHEIAGEIVGFCWTKVHTDLDPPVGEIYVIGVDPSVGGMGIGQQLLYAGLDHLAGLGIGEAMLYVESDNEPALALYRSNGFEIHLHHKWWRLTL